MPVNAPNDNLEMIAPGFKLKNIDNNIISLTKLKVKMVLLLFLYVIIVHMLKQLQVD